ncbi:MAG: GntR family transcriptional regulator [Spirochaetes bacterium GWF1_31_7]|nr:MAG: GntR family transcriptional regulator [Spirochaetes bacterium GWE1_32_154]OHD46902.1 MAG: GntR family transcriptional regulator [Spirochaetes bacterium GWF1_31_7]OHD48680.1 MAG: GntR family transcriptional regulator [Spirochaetes bacterium GWE2_31_10]OHD74551.1 MAG: GntR family transcriptional regulator [Spirochaetes bacterium RIFOXYB1_FULL_32_8]HBD94906.1 GntR family transcriptional regulator [Spirochaetia bacterium]
MGIITIEFEIDEKNGVPFYKQIIQQVEVGIATGRLKPGDRLPTIRALAIKLKINPNTIAKSYNEMELKGLVVTQVGSGTYIADCTIDVDEVTREKKLNELCGNFIASIRQLGFEKEFVVKYLEEYK